jgi:predicted nucleotide-binding protein (sugar kinase/HSP70/actin superfamily)
MGRLGTEAVAAGVRALGYNAIAANPGDEGLLKMGRAHTSGKECLPLILTTGTLVDHIGRKRENEVLLYFIPTADGPCRFGQYHVFMDNLIRRNEFKDVATFSLHSGDGYKGLGREFSKRVLWSSVISDLMEDIRSLILANSLDKSVAMELFEAQFLELTRALEYEDWEGILRTLAEVGLAFSAVKGRRPWEAVPMISIVGEIFVRRDDLSRQWLTEHLAEEGFAVRCAHVTEWIKYCQVVAEFNQRGRPLDLLKTKLRQRWIARVEAQVRNALSGSGLILSKAPQVTEILQASSHYIDRRLGTEALLTVGGGLHEIASQTAGVISIGPFGCMPNRISEAILNEVMTSEDKVRVSVAEPELVELLQEEEKLPFLSIESDGRRFPQAIEARLESFLLRVRRLHERLLKHRKKISS